MKKFIWIEHWYLTKILDTFVLYFHSIFTIIDNRRYLDYV